MSAVLPTVENFPIFSGGVQPSELSADTWYWVCRYRQLGICAIPAPWGEKGPKIDWRTYQKRVPTDDELRAWFDDGKPHNVAAVCGAISGNLVVLDNDLLDNYFKFFDGAQKVERKTLVAVTGGGKRHVYFRTPRPIPSSKIPQLKLEIRSEGNVVIAPPSLHPSGNYYHFVDPGITEIPVVDDLLSMVWRIAEQKFGVKRQEFTQKELGSPIVKREFSTPYRGIDPPCIQTVLRGVGEGSRNWCTLALAAYFLFTQKLDTVAARRKMLEWNLLNSPPQSERKVIRTMNEVAKRGYTFGCSGLSAFCNREGCPFKGEKSGLDVALAEAQALEVK